MELSEYARLDAVGLRDLLRSGRVSPGEVERVARRALRRADDAVRGLAFGPFEPALEHSPDGALAGVPFLIKDVPFATGVPFAVGSRALGPGVPAAHDHDLMARFRAAGLVTLGSTTMPELGLGFTTEPLRHGPTRNPWDPGRSAGGSSGGSAALVAAGAVPAAHGNDAAGSLRIPASCCGLVGLKPSRGRVPCGPDAGEVAFGTAYEFVLTRTVRDTAHLLDVAAGPVAGDKYTAPPPRRPYAREPATDPGRLRVAVTTAAWSGAPIDPRVAAAAVRVARLLEHSGHAVAEDSPAVDWELFMHGMTAGTVALAAPFLLAPRLPDPARMEAVSRRALEQARSTSALDLLAMLDAQNRVTRAVGAFFTGYDLLVTPTLAQLPVPLGTLRQDDPDLDVRAWLDTLFGYGPFTALFNVSGQPAISLPLGWSDDGLPIGVQLVAGYGREDLLLRVAARLEEALPWADRHPPLWVGG